MLPHAGQDIAKGRRLFMVPSSLLEGKAPQWSKRMPNQCHQAVEPQEQWRRPLNGQVRPLALRLDTQMRPAFLEGGFHTPTLHEIAHNLFSRLCLIGGKEGFGRSFSCRIAGEDPADRQGSRPKAIPTGGSRTELQRPLAFSVPVQGEALPHGLWILQEVFE
jgi:hypothetical protein